MAIAYFYCFIQQRIIPNLSVEGAFDSAMDGVTHIIHAGSPLPMPTCDITTEVFLPIILITQNLLKAASKAPSVRRVVITSSIASNLPLDRASSSTTPVSASHREQMPDPIIPEKWSNGFEGYTHGKRVELLQTDDFAKKQPHFTISHILPGFVFGRNELMLNCEMNAKPNSTNDLLMYGMLGKELPLPMHGAFAHIDDVAEAHLKVAFLEGPESARDFGIATKVDFGSIFDIVEKAFPKATDDVEKMLGKLRGFEEAVTDVAGQYLEILGIEKA
ncbi:NAD(P)-binding protein [Xylariaceae sp. FL0255]|nr:NAD(P)-binding protein [Xylariaceae sp. FL0255]